MFPLHRLAISTVLCLLTTAAFAQNPGDLAVSPTRVELADQARSTDISLLNRSNQTLRYRLSFVDMSMSETGVLTRTATTPASSAAAFLRIAPREIALGPGQSQRIKVLVSFPDGTPDGEYLSHLSFDCISDPRSVQAKPASGDAISLSLRIRTIVTIPVIVRHGSLSATATISDAALSKQKTNWVATFKLNRTGTRSIRGDVKALFIPDSGGKKVLLGEYTGLPVYTTNPFRVVTVSLKQDPATLGQGHLEIDFAEPAAHRGALAAEATIPVGK